jgi:hypothetical protein
MAGMRRIDRRAPHKLSVRLIAASDRTRVMALAGALCHTLLAATGFTNKRLCVLMTALLGSAYTPANDPRPAPAPAQRAHPPTLVCHRYTLTSDGIRIAVFSTPRSTTGSSSRSRPPTSPSSTRPSGRARGLHPPCDDYANRPRLARAA